MVWNLLSLVSLDKSLNLIVKEWLCSDFSDMNRHPLAQSLAPKCPVLYDWVSGTLLYPGELCLVLFIYLWFATSLKT